MFHTEVVVLELFALFLRGLHHGSQVTAYLRLCGSSALGGFMGHFTLCGLKEKSRITGCLAENGRQNAAFLLQQRHQNIKRRDFRLSQPPRGLLRLHQRFLKFCC